MKPRFSRSPEGFYQYFFSDPHVKALTSTRVFNGRFEEDAPGERQRLFTALKLSPLHVVGAVQTHETCIQTVEWAHRGKGSLKEADAFQGTDGFLTREPETVLSIKTADCLPIFLFDPSSRAISVIHAGWKGLAAGIVDKGIESLRSRCGSNPACLEAVMGPSIRREDYEVGKEFVEYFPEDVHPKVGGQKFCFDLPGACLKRLMRSGLREENVLDPGLSTFRDAANFFSYRREGNVSGRMLSLIWRT